ncbi:MAG: DUF5658 family protein [Planctomycetaceae bacterium]|nr:DUF5658 family protein [Planctomycetaceae bacterium]
MQQRLNISDMLSCRPCLSLVAVCLCLTPPAFAADGVADEPTQFIDATSEGMLFFDGQFVPGPYNISASQTVLKINDHVITIPQSEVEPQQNRNGNGNGNGNGGARRGPGNRGQANRGPGGPGGPGFRNGRGRRPRPFVEYENALEDEYYEDPYYEDDYDSVRGIARTGRSISGWLQNDYIVFVKANGKSSYFSDASQIYPLFELIMSPVPTSQQIALYDDNRALAYSAEEWPAFRENIERTEALDAEMFRRMTFIEELEAANESRVRAVQRMEYLSYPLTIVGMLLSVIAFGHMLQWSGRGLAAINDTSVSPESVRYGVVALWLMMGMSVVDLCWTVLASQAGAMQETNPLAAGMLDSPLRLAGFKVLATGVGLGILYAWRRRAQIQQATWWMCLVCVLLTFRWVVFDTLSG